MTFIWMFTKLMLMEVFNFKLSKDKYEIVNNNRKYRQTFALNYTYTLCSVHLSIGNESKRKSNKYWNIIVHKLNAFNSTHNTYTANTNTHSQKKNVFILYGEPREICDLFSSFPVSNRIYWKKNRKNQTGWKWKKNELNNKVITANAMKIE